MQGRIVDGTLFPNMAVAIVTDLERAVRDTTTRLQRIIKQSLEGIQKNFDFTLAPPPRDNNGTNEVARHENQADAQIWKKHSQDVFDQAKSFKERHASLLESIESLY